MNSAAFRNGKTCLISNKTRSCKSLLFIDFTGINQQNYSTFTKIVKYFSTGIIYFQFTQKAFIIGLTL